MRKPDNCKGSIPWNRRGGHIDCDSCESQFRRDAMLWCERYGNSNDPSLISKKAQPLPGVAP